MKSQIVKQFGINVRRLREKAELTQEELAEKADIHLNYVGYIERGVRNITLEKVVKIARVLKCKPSQIFQDLF